MCKKKGDFDCECVRRRKKKKNRKNTKKAKKQKNKKTKEEKKIAEQDKNLLWLSELPAKSPRRLVTEVVYAR